MNLFFYMVFPFCEGTATFQLPLFIEASGRDDAKEKSDQLLTLIKAQFEVLFEPSDPVRVMPNVNETRFKALVDLVDPDDAVCINLPVDFDINVYQHDTKSDPLQSVLAKVIVSGPHSSYFSL